MPDTIIIRSGLMFNYSLAGFASKVVQLQNCVHMPQYKVATTVYSVVRDPTPPSATRER